MLYQVPINSNDIDIVFGNGQPFGNPMGFGGPHAAFLSGKLKYLRHAPGRIVGMS